MENTNNEQDLNETQQSGEEIIAGARNDDQLDKLNDDGENNTGTENEDTENTMTTQGDAAEQEENLGGTTNLSLDQLKSEKDPAGD